MLRKKLFQNAIGEQKVNNKTAHKFVITFIIHSFCYQYWINLHFEGQLVKKPSFLELLYTPNPTRSCANKLARPDLGHAQACTVSSGSSTALGWKVCVGAGGLTWPHLYGLLKSRSESTHLPHPAVEGEAAKVPGSQGWPKPDHSTNPLNTICRIGAILGNLLWRVPGTVSWYKSFLLTKMYFCWM